MVFYEYYSENIAVDKKNDNAKEMFFQGSNRWNSTTDMLKAKHRIHKLKHRKRETHPHEYKVSGDGAKVYLHLKLLLVVFHIYTG